MGRKLGTGGRSAKSGRNGGGIAQLARRQVINTYQPIELADPDQIQQLHDTSMRILSELGIRVMSDRVMALFEAAGARVDRGTSITRLDESIVMEAVGKAPGQFTLTGRNADKRLTIGGNNICFGLVAGPPNVHDRVNGRRDGNLADYQNFIRLAHHFNAIDFIGNQVISPMELPANNRHLDTYFANLTLSDLSFHCTGIGRGRALDGIRMMAITRGMSVEEMASDPGVITIISVNSPRLFDDAMAEGLIAMAEHGQPVTVTPFTLMGAMTPVTLAAALAQQNAEALFGIALTQLVNPGVPVGCNPVLLSGLISARLVLLRQAAPVPDARRLHPARITAPAPSGRTAASIVPERAQPPRPGRPGNTVACPPADRAAGSRRGRHGTTG